MICDYMQFIVSIMTEEAKLLHTAYCTCKVKVHLNFNLGPIV